MAAPDIDPSDAKLIAQAKAAAAARQASENANVNAASDALRKLTSGATLNDAERALLNMGPAQKLTPYDPLSGKVPDYKAPYVSPELAAGEAYGAAGDAQAAEAAALAAKAKADADAAAAKTADEIAKAKAAQAKAEADAAAARAALATANSTNAIAAQQKAAADALAKQQARDNIITVMRSRYK